MVAKEKKCIMRDIQEQKDEMDSQGLVTEGLEKVERSSMKVGRAQNEARKITCFLKPFR